MGGWPRTGCGPVPRVAEAPEDMEPITEDAQGAERDEEPWRLHVPEMSSCCGQCPEGQAAWTSESGDEAGGQ